MHHYEAFSISGDTAKLLRRNGCKPLVREWYQLASVDGPCSIHRDFRPANVIVHDGKLKGIIDWASGQKRAQIFFESGNLVNGDKIDAISHKTPWYNREGKLLGIQSLSFISIQPLSMI